STSAAEIRLTHPDWLCPALLEMDVLSDRVPGVAEHARQTTCHSQPSYAVQVNDVSKIIRSGLTPGGIDHHFAPFYAPGVFLRHPIVRVPFAIFQIVLRRIFVRVVVAISRMHHFQRPFGRVVEYFTLLDKHLVDPMLGSEGPVAELQQRKDILS